MSNLEAKLEQNWQLSSLRGCCSDFVLPFLLEAPEVGVRICRYKDASPQLLRRQTFVPQLYWAPQRESFEMVTYDRIKRINRNNIKLVTRLFVTFYLLMFLVIAIVYYQFFFMYLWLLPDISLLKKVLSWSNNKLILSCSHTKLKKKLKQYY